MEAIDCFVLWSLPCVIPMDILAVHWNHFFGRRWSYKKKWNVKNWWAVCMHAGHGSLDLLDFPNAWLFDWLISWDHKQVMDSFLFFCLVGCACPLGFLLALSLQWTKYLRSPSQTKKSMKFCCQIILEPYEYSSPPQHDFLSPPGGFFLFWPNPIVWGSRN